MSDSLAVSSPPPLLPVCTESSRQRRDRQRKLHNIRSADLNTQSNPVDIGRRCRRYSNTDTQSQSETLTHTDAEKERQKTNTRRHTTQIPKHLSWAAALGFFLWRSLWTAANIWLFRLKSVCLLFRSSNLQGTCDQFCFWWVAKKLRPTQCLIFQNKYFLKQQTSTSTW